MSFSVSHKKYQLAEFAELGNQPSKEGDLSDAFTAFVPSSGWENAENASNSNFRKSLKKTSWF
jgi:hypothetical protein